MLSFKGFLAEREILMNHPLRAPNNLCELRLITDSFYLFRQARIACISLVHLIAPCIPFSNLLPVPSVSEPRSEIKTVEVIGVRDAAIVYRDRNGNILFQTDPLANVTIVTKNIDLPEVTIRETETTEVERVPAETTGPSNPPHGCESAFARPSPESLTRTPSRCLT